MERPRFLRILCICDEYLPVSFMVSMNFKCSMGVISSQRKSNYWQSLRSSRTLTTFCNTDFPSTKTSPSVGLLKPTTRLIRVVFPEPLFPRRHIVSPLPTLMSTPFKAMNSLKTLRAPTTERIGVPFYSCSRDTFSFLDFLHKYHFPLF